MKVFHCDHCEQLVFFENTQCMRCGRLLAYLPDLETVASLDDAGSGLWQSPLQKGDHRGYRLCDNYSNRNVCNWAVNQETPHSLCVSCRLTRVIPDLGREGNKEAWYQIEVAKRRLVYSLLRMGCPVRNQDDDPQSGLAFELLADSDEPGAERVLTGHDNGVITLNIAEADDAERERRRRELGEPYRTLLGHLRHEVGHYYWDLLISRGPRLEAFRGLFGDERRDYRQALSEHYAQGPPANWQQRFISEYASAHAWEDWAETWAHYLHMVDALETAAECGMSLRPQGVNEPELEAGSRPWSAPFDTLIGNWFPLTYVLNNLNRGLGLPDGYPFVLSATAIEKLRFVHDTVAYCPQPSY